MENDQNIEKPKELDVNLIEEAADACDAGVCRELLDKGADVNVTDEEGCTPLIWAVLAGSVEAVELFLARGADPNCKNSDGETPMHITALTGNLEIAKLLIDAGADVEAEDGFGITPLRSCELNEDEDMALLLKEHCKRAS
jgi:cytohesin